MKLAAPLLLITALAAAGAVRAEPPTQEMLAGAELRRNIDWGGLDRYEVLKLKADGTFSGNFEKRRPVRGGEYLRQTGDMNGRWSLQGNLLCFEGSGLEYKGRSCFELTKKGNSAREYAGAHKASGDVWQFFIYPPGS